MILITRTKLRNEHSATTKINKNKLNKNKLLKLKLFCKLSSGCINFLIPQSKRNKKYKTESEICLQNVLNLLIAKFTIFNQSCFSKNLNPLGRKKENISVPWNICSTGSESRKKDKKTKQIKWRKNIKKRTINKDLYTATKIIFGEKFLVSCIYGCLHWRSQGNFNKREKVWRKWSV